MRRNSHASRDFDRFAALGTTGSIALSAVAGGLAAVAATLSSGVGVAQSLPTPTTVITRNPQVGPGGPASCADQLDDAIFAADLTALGIEAFNVGAQVGSLADPTDAADGPFLILEASAVTAQSVAAGAALDASNLPNCDAAFTGTVAVQAGGVNVTGVSIFNDDVGVAGDLTTTGALGAATLEASGRHLRIQ